MRFAIPQQITLAFTLLLGGLLVGYAVGGRGFAHHTGFHPLYLSEILLLLGIVIMLLGIRRWRRDLTSLLLITFLGYGAIHTAFVLNTYGLDAARDAVIWLYGLVALAVVVVMRQEHLPTLARIYRWAVPVFLIWTPIASVIRRRFQDSVPSLPFTDVGVVYFKSGDFAVHLAAVAGFIILGLMSTRGRPVGWGWQVPLWLMWAVAVFVVLNSRSAMLTIILGVLLAQSLHLLRPPGSSPQKAPLVLPWVMVAGLLALSSALDFQYETAGGDVKIDGKYVVNGLTSMFGVTFIGDPDADRDANGTSVGGSTEEIDDETEATGVVFDRTSQRQLNTREWRLSWWRTIIDYTVLGEYFWTGKGFGVNLAESDGYQIDQDPPLRSPHNVHMTFLARMGVPGVVGWVLLQAVFAIGMFRVFMRQSLSESGQRVQAAAGFVMVFWLAVLVNSSFDVYLEGPQGGIWFWAVFGLGLALIGIDQHERQRDSQRIVT
jgi:hypothetical protein